MSGSSPPPAAPAPAAPAPAEDEAAILPGQHWANLQAENDGSSLLGDDEDSTASLRTSILQYRTVAGRTYHGDVGEAEYWSEGSVRRVVEGSY
ncbi:hypothetical protein ACHAQA_004315 [Verticillium albo-atrum]